MIRAAEHGKSEILIQKKIMWKMIFCYRVDIDSYI